MEAICIYKDASKKKRICEMERERRDVGRARLSRIDTRRGILIPAR